MPMSINPVSIPMPLKPAGLDAGGGANRPGGAAGEPSFKQYLVDSLKQVNTMQHVADRGVLALARGGHATREEVLTPLQKAVLAFRMTRQIRSKLGQAFQEVQ